MTTAIKLTQLYTILLEKQGKESADAIVTYIEEKVPYEMEAQKSTWQLELERMKSEIKDEISKNHKDVQTSLRNQFWLIVVMFIPIWIALFMQLKK